ncbi:MAG: GDP-L-fucose synthase [Actinomycetota bacterium]|jgi:GDP-L-fucose synthase
MDTPAATTLDRDAPVYVAGHRGLVGAAIVRHLEAEGFTRILTATRDQVDLRSQSEVSHWFKANRPQYVFLVAGTVGGILANSTRPAEFIYDNMMIHGTVVHSAYETGVEKLLYLGSSCIYPRHATQPITEDQLLTGPLEQTNEWYAIAKIAGIKLCQAYRRQYGCDFVSAMPTNLYGPGDNFDLTSSHVIPALMRKFHDARVSGGDRVEVWGTGSAYREFLHVDDLARACLFLLERYSDDTHINVGTGVDLSIKELAETIRSVVHPDAEIAWDTSKPDGTPRKLLDVSKLRGLGWEPEVTLADGLRSTYEWFLATEASGAGLRGVGAPEPAR